jgi:hypothetical protein
MLRAPALKVRLLMYKQWYRCQARQTNEEHIIHQRSEISKEQNSRYSEHFSKGSDVHTASDVADTSRFQILVLVPLNGMNSREVRYLSIRTNTVLVLHNEGFRKELYSQ